jgi:hypothetical protein
MINKIIDGISIAINSCFGDEYEIYTESVEQGLQEPCFSIVCLNPTIEQFLGSRYFRQNQFCIHYFPSSKDKRAECYSVMEKLSNALEIIEANGETTRGTQMHGEFVDDMLHFFVNYDMFVYKQEEPASPMETAIYGADVKG